MAEVSVAHGSMSILRTRIRLSCIMPDFGAVSTWPCGDWAEKITQQPCIVWKISCHRRWRIFVVVSAEFQYASTVDGIWCDGPHRNKTDILNVIQPVDVGILSIRLRLQPRKFLFVFIVTFKQMISGGEFGLHSSHSVTERHVPRAKIIWINLSRVCCVGHIVGDQNDPIRNVPPIFGYAQIVVTIYHNEKCPWVPLGHHFF